MRISIVYIGRIRTRVGSREEVVEAEPSGTVLQMLERLVERHGKEFRQLVFGNGDLAAGVNVIVDGLNVTNRVMSSDSEEVARLPSQDSEAIEVELVILDAPPSGGH